LQRVTRAFESAQSRGGNVHLRLSPPELGAVHIELRVQEGVLSARLETDNSAARTALLDNLPALKERLADQGMRIENFEVNVGGGGTNGMPDRPQDRPDQPRFEPVRRAREVPVGAPVEAGARTPGRPTDGALNVMV
jgi:flagellar hook-length control protein FliK